MDDDAVIGTPCPLCSELARLGIGSEEHTKGAWALLSEVARLRAENDRVRQAGIDLLVQTVLGQPGRPYLEEGGDRTRFVWKGSEE